MNLADDKSRNRRRNGFIARFRDGVPAYVSIPAGVLFVLGGVFSFLPVLGPWMLPVGLAILAPRVPFARRLLRRIFKLSLKYKIIQKRKVEHE